MRKVTNLIDERKYVCRGDGLHDQGDQGERDMVPWHRCLGFSLEQRGLLIRTSVIARHGKKLSETQRIRTGVESALLGGKLNLHV